MALPLRGYSDGRFQESVDDDLHCPICWDVLREPVHCGQNEHYFCRSCITTHLKACESCPYCQDHLSVASLKPPSRFVTNRLNRLILSCDNADRGCEEKIELGRLSGHVENCGFSPAQCPNEGCIAVVNRSDYERHVKRECEFREQCRDCLELKEELGEVKIQLDEHCLELREMKTKLDEKCVQLAEVKKNLEDTRLDLGEVKTKLDEKCLQLVEVSTKLEEKSLDFNNVRRELGKVKKELEEVKEMLCKVYQREQTIPETIEEVRQDFVIMGGSKVKNEPLDCVDMFHWSTMSWEQLQPLNTARCRASAFAYDGQVIIAGGLVLDEGKIVPWERMEKISLVSPECSARWSSHDMTLPSKKSGQKCVEHEGHLLVIGGYDDKDGMYTNAIHDIPLNPPFSPRIVARLPSPRRFFGTEIFGDRVLFVGGLKTKSMDTCLDTVTEYNVKTNTFRERPPLPFPVTGMATVAWQDKLVVIGGMDKASKALDSVILYDVDSGQSTMLPTMIEGRGSASAIATGNVIVVMGGTCGKRRLSSVECFDFSTQKWQEFPSLSIPRSYACAIVKPHC